MSDSLKDRQRQQSVIKVEGELTVENAGALQQKLHAAIEGSESIVMEFSDNAMIDLAFLQLACSAYRSSLDAGKDLKLSSPIPESLMNAVKTAGFAYHPVWDLQSSKKRGMCNGGRNE